MQCRDCSLSLSLSLLPRVTSKKSVSQRYFFFFTYEGFRASSTETRKCKYLKTQAISYQDDINRSAAKTVRKHTSQTEAHGWKVGRGRARWPIISRLHLCNHLSQSRNTTCSITSLPLCSLVGKTKQSDLQLDCLFMLIPTFPKHTKSCTNVRINECHYMHRV